MSEYTFRETPVRPRVAYVGYKDATYDIVDGDLNSRDYFQIVEFPEKFTAGKNLIKLRANPNGLVDASRIYIEILDSAGNPIFYKPLQYLEKSGNRVIAVYIYPETAPGIATVYLAGRAAIDPTGNKIASSKDITSDNYLNIPNVIWSRTAAVAPFEKNTTEIIFEQIPKVTVTENIQTYRQPILLSGIQTQDTASVGDTGLTVGTPPYYTNTSPGGMNADMSSWGSTTIDMSSDDTVTPPSDPPVVSNPLPAVFPQGASTPGTPDSYFGATVGFGAGISLADNDVNADSLSSTDNATAVSADLSFITSFAVVNIDLSDTFQFNQQMVGGTLTIREPNVTLELATNERTFATESKLIPLGQYDTSLPGGATIISSSGTYKVFGDYNFQILEVENAYKAKVAQKSGFLNSDYNTNGAPAFAFPIYLTTNTENSFTFSENRIISNITSTNTYTASYIGPPTISETENSASFADIILSNIEPETGDVFKIKTLYKPAGAFGDFQDLGDTILEEQELLVDESTLETDVIIGSVFEHFGRIDNQEEIDTYWEVDAPQPVTAFIYETTASFDNTNLIGGIKINRRPTAFGIANGYTGDTSASYEEGAAGNPLAGVPLNTNLSIKQAYRPDITKNTKYVLRFSAVLHAEGSDNSLSTDSRIPTPRIDVYLSGSNVAALNSTIIDIPGGTRPQNWGETFNYDLYKDGGLYGYRIGTITGPTVLGSRANAEFRFEALKDATAANLRFVVRSGNWTIGNISFKTDVQTGYSPNFARIFKRIPTAHLKTPLTFRFQLQDINGNVAEVQPAVFGAVFQGENFYIDGTNNIMTGSLYIGNQIGSGVEMAGANSGFIRSVGYLGFQSASRGDAPGGFMLFSGSILPTITDEYSYGGVGLELVQDADNLLRFKTTGPDAGLLIRTPNFFLGGTSQYISGSNGNIEIVSDNFNLSPEGFVTATNFAEKLIIVNQANSASYFLDDDSTGVKLVFDGTGGNSGSGGELTMNMQLDVAPWNETAGAIKPITGILVANTGSNRSAVDIIINADGVQFSDSSVGVGTSNYLGITPPSPTE